MHTANPRASQAVASAISLSCALLACGGAHEVSTAAHADASDETRGPSFGSSDARLLAALDSAVARWNTAGCLALVVSGSPDHALLFDDGSRMAEGRMAQATGTWASATIRVVDDGLYPWHYTPEYLERLVMHEMAHVLALTNAHVADGALGPGAGDNTITDATLSRVCARSHCACFNVEIRG